RAFPASQVVLRPLGLDEMDKALASGALDFFITNPGDYTEMETRYGAARLVTLETVQAGVPGASVGAVIFTRADRREIRSLNDLHGKRLMAVSEEAFGGFQIGWGVLQRTGIDPFRDLSGLTFAGFPLDNIVRRVGRGEADVGIVRACLLEEMAGEGAIDLADFRVLNAQHPPGFDCALSSPLYPNWPFAKARGTDHALAKRAAVALLGMAPDGGGQAWTIPLSYQPVTELFKELHIAPYELTPQQVMRDFVARYRYWFLLALGLVILAALHVWRTEFLVVRRTRQLQESEERARLRLAELAHVSRQQTLGEMARGLAHEINQPLGSIANYAAGSVRMIEGGAPAARLEEPLREIAHQAEHAGRVIRRIRGFVDSGDVSRRAPVDIVAAITEALELLGAELRRAGAEVETDLERGLPKVPADLVGIEQVLVNLLRNAAEAMGAVPEGQRRLRVAARRRGAAVAVEVCDTGPGLEPARMAGLFEPFRGDKPQGMGLGLSISKSIVESHGGRIGAHENAGGGLCVRFTLPLEGEA
ncbi:MAG TPA: sensor protein, partial [Rhodobacterales bacterium]|nr:sensor protein [Rhodobacterales bacterium]